MTGESGLDMHIEAEGCQAGSAVTLAGKENPLPPEWQRYVHGIEKKVGKTPSPVEGKGWGEGAGGPWVPRCGVLW